MRLSTLALAPLGALYGTLGLVRERLYRRGVLPAQRLGGPVISVGNLSVGGSGKTPLVAWAAALLRDAGHRVAILSRGYGGRYTERARLVSDGRESSAGAEIVGDEPAMLARELPGVIVAVGRRRADAGGLVEAQFGPCVHILDDGFQHLRLARDLDLLCLEPADARDWPLPAGRLREFPRAAARADLLLVSGADARGTEELGARFGAERVLRMHRRTRGFFAPWNQERPAPARAFLFCGIARPQRFLDDVRARGVDVVGQALFRDHHRFTIADVAIVTRSARAAGADALVTTAKDAVRLSGVETGLPLLTLRIAAVVEPEEPLRQRLLSVAGATPDRRRAGEASA
jgi:tetraacyldisaccharide 4'-kinase